MGEGSLELVLRELMKFFIFVFIELSTGITCNPLTPLLDSHTYVATVCQS